MTDFLSEIGRILREDIILPSTIFKKINVSFSSQKMKLKKDKILQE
jgi:hypothetical protein